MIMIFVLLVGLTSTSYALPISQEEIKRVGSLIYKNECSSDEKKLIFWSEREDFPSLGIGHFIWHTKSGATDKTQQFPELIAHFKKENITIPKWLSEHYAPWKDRKEFLAEHDSARIKELRQLLSNTIPLQAQFIVERFQKMSLDRIAQLLSGDEQKKFKKQLDRLYSVPNGYVVLIDYTNFKGDGTNPAERYNNQGWGLMQVMLNMKETNNPLHDFVISAQDLLAARVANAALEKNEQKWLPGWNNRIRGYLSTK